MIQLRARVQAIVVCMYVCMYLCMYVRVNPKKNELFQLFYFRYSKENINIYILSIPAII
jgi:hypothetical protein